MPEISVIVPVYNVAVYIKRCVESILAQTYENFELILVDDGSTDNSLDICKEYSKKDERVHVYTKTNGGVSTARNFGVTKSKGKYIIFIDSDDFVSDKFLEKLYKSCIDNNAQISLVNFDGIIDEAQAVPKYTDEQIVMTNREAIELSAEKCGPNFRSAVCKLVDSEIIKKHPFPKNRIWSEDTACVYKWYWEADKIVEYKGTMYFYYCNPNSVSNSDFDSKYLQELDTYEEMLEFYCKNDFDSLHKRFVFYSLEVAYGYYVRAVEGEYKKIARQFQKRIRSLIKRFGKEYDINIATKTDLFDIAYPRRTHLYRIFKRFTDKI